MESRKPEVSTEAGGELGGSFMEALNFTTAPPCIFRSTARKPHRLDAIFHLRV